MAGRRRRPRRPPRPRLRRASPGSRPPTSAAEALAIALALREAAETGTRAALVTPDRQLARRVTAELDRWALIPDDSAGRPLALTPPGVLLRRLAALPGQRLTPEDLLVLLKHPLTDSAPGARGPHLRLTARLETQAPPRRRPLDRLARPRRLGRRSRRRSPRLDRLAPSHPRPARRRRDPPRSTPTSPATAPPPRRWPPAPRSATTHALWEQDAGAQARALLDALAAEAAAAAPLDATAYRALLQSQMAARDVPEPAVTTHPGIAIWGTLEARVQSADLVILGGLNEGTWPRLPAADPWLGRGLRRAIGLPSPDRRIGLSAHDFQQAMGAPRVILTRATRDAEAPTVASRWLLRLENLLLGLGPEGQDALAAAKARGQPPRRATPPASTSPPPPSRPPAAPPPRPPAAARPAELSVTQVERLVRDPYGIYARKVLRLRRLDPPGRKPDALARGTAIHAALDAFVTATEAGLPDDAAAVYRAAVARRAGRGRALARRQRHLDRAPRPRRAVVPRRRGRAPRPRRARRPRGQGPPRGRRPRAPLRRHRPRRPHRPRCPAASPSTTTSPAPARPAPRRAPSTSSSRSRPPSPRPAASRACPPPPRCTSSS